MATATDELSMGNLFKLLALAIECENGEAAQDVAGQIVGKDGEWADCLVRQERIKFNGLVRDKSQVLSPSRNRTHHFVRPITGENNESERIPDSLCGGMDTH